MNVHGAENLQTAAVDTGMGQRNVQVCILGWGWGWDGWDRVFRDRAVGVSGPGPRQAVQHLGFGVAAMNLGRLTLT